MAASRREVLKLYKDLLTESRKFPFYNFRQFAVRKVRDTFRTNKSISDQAEINAKIVEGKKDLAIIARQVTIGQAYATDKLVIENVGRLRASS